eukprot:scaffold867_cov176-Ochromonas_danica.AAC.15
MAIKMRSNAALQMGGGRSLEEKSMTKKMMFRNLREKLNTAAQIPGFFEVGEGTPEIDLYCKSNKDGTQIGDCPYAQFIQLVMLKKGIRYNVKPTLSSNKPAWLVEKHEGKLPALVHKDVVVTDSLAIAEYLEKTFPHSSLTRQGVFSYQEILEKTAGFFPALSNFIKNKDASKDEALKALVEKELDNIDEILRSTPGQYLCGVEVTLADLYLVPQLFHGVVALDHFKQFEFYNINSEPTRPALESYLTRMFDMEEFNNKLAYYNVDKIIYGWKVARGDA